MDVTTIITGYVRLKSMGLEIIVKSPYHGSFVLISNKNSSGNESLGSASIIAQGRSHINSGNTCWVYVIFFACAYGGEVRMSVL